VETPRSFLKDPRVLRVLAVTLGGLAGYGYYATVGCVTGSCPITGNPWSSTAYGALIGFLVAPHPWRKERQ
jgi:hypothetical protein